ncbi:MAG: vWA domain-containing protein [Acetobacteraceae bacterium]
MASFWKLGGLAAGAALTLTVGMTSPAEASLYQVGFLLDSSGSIGAGGWSTITNGLANAIHLFAEAPDQYELSVVSFSTGTATIINKQIVTNANLISLKNAITGASWLDSNTNYQAAFNAITSVMDPAHSQAAASYVNFATDGKPNRPFGDPEQDGIDARNAAITAGIDNISVEGIGGDVNATYLKNSICYPTVCSTSTPPTGFPGKGFYIAIASVDDYGAAIQTKIKTIINTPEPASVAVLGSALVGIAALARRRRR